MTLGAQGGGDGGGVKDGLFGSQEGEGGGGQLGLGLQGREAGNGISSSQLASGEQEQGENKKNGLCQWGSEEQGFGGE